MGKVSFTVSARTAKLIGQENFATSEGAIIELVKNSYDADANNCVIVFKNEKPNDSVLYIIDNGVGMTDNVIKTQWMKIGTDEKLENFQSDHGRVKTGAKGIGRFALDRLGLSSKMYTVSKDSIDGLVWKVTWSDFDKAGLSIEDVEADLDYEHNLNLKAKLVELFQSNAALLTLIEKVNFLSGTILEIKPLKDKWLEDDIKRLFNNLEVLIPPQEQPEFQINLYSTKNLEEFGEIKSAYYDDFDYKVEAKYNNNLEELTVKITRNELKVDELENFYKEIFEDELMAQFPYDLNTFKGKEFVIKRSIKDVSSFSKAEESVIKQIGDFEFIFYFLKNTLQDDRTDGDIKKKYPYKQFSSANRKAWLKKFGGVKIFRDDFRVRPYGENGQDWLSLGDRQAKSPGGPGQKIGGYRIGPNQIAGTIKISRITNAYFQDKSGREGIQENEVFELFKNLIEEIISLFERDRNIVMYSLSEQAKKQFSNEEEKRKAKEEAARILQQEETESQKNIGNEVILIKQETKNTETELLLAKATKIFEQELYEKDEEIRLLRSLASVGLIITSFAHELKGLRARLTPRTEFLRKELNKYITQEKLINVNQEDNPFYMLDLITQEDIKLKHWLEYSLSSLKTDKRTRSNINIGEYFDNFFSVWNKALQQRKVNVTLKGTKDMTNVIRGFEVDLDAIFNNLLSNSLSAFKERKGNYQRNVEVSWKVIDEFLHISFSDNGIGLSSEYKQESNRIFEYSESSKRDRKGNKIGTGMGLYIVSLVVNDYNEASVKILPTNEGFAIGFSFPKRK